jgi:hypothetical protein
MIFKLGFFKILLMTHPPCIFLNIVVVVHHPDNPIKGFLPHKTLKVVRFYTSYTYDTKISNPYSQKCYPWSSFENLTSKSQVSFRNYNRNIYFVRKKERSSGPA